MGCPCARCGDRYTQSLPMVYGTGTSIRDWRSPSGRSGSSISQSIVSRLAAPPIKRSVLKPLLWLLLVGCLFGSALSLQFERLSTPGKARNSAPIVERSRVQHRHPGPAADQFSHQEKQNGQGLWVIAAPVIAVIALLMWLIIRAVRFNRFVYPQQVERWRLSSMCRSCGAIF